MTFRKKLLEQTRRDIKRLDEKARRPVTWVEMLIYGGTLGLMFVVPIVVGAYLGQWLDSLCTKYSSSWTVSLIILGIVIGGYNVFRLLQKKY